jgi:photosystem II stability/assembly factor-like uncharacterized protein
MKRSGMLAGVLSFITLLSAAHVNAEQWVRGNMAPDPFVRNARVFANVPSAGQTTIFVASLANGVSKVVDTGSSQTVTQLNNGLPMLRIRTIQGNDATNLYVGLDGHGVYKSTDGGASWAAANGSGITSLKCREVRNLGVRSNSEIWAVTGCRHDSGVYRTLDGGATWTRLGAGTISDDTTIGAITFSGTGPTTIVVIATARDGMFRSGDNGGTWTQINNGLPSPHGANRISVFNAVFLAASSDMLAYVEGYGVYRTTDNGANWAAFGTGFPATAHSLGGIQRQSASTFYLGTDKGPVYRTTDAGATWSPLGNTGNADEWRFIRSVATDGLGRTYLSGHNGLVRTTDNLTFTFIYLGEGYASDMILDPDGKTAYVTAQSIFRIPDLYKPLGAGNDGVDIGGGLPGSMSAGRIAQDKSQHATLYAGLTNFGLYKSTNGGAGWAKLDLPNVEVGTNPFVAISPSNGQVLYGVPGNKYGTASGGGIYKSVNGGSTWTNSSTGLVTPEARDVNSVALHQDAPLALVIATDDGIYRSADGGATWTNTLQIFDDQATALPMSSVRYHPFDPQIVYATANHVNADSTVRASSGVWKSVNGGATWTQVLSAKRAASVRVEGSGRVIVMLNRDRSQPALLASGDGGATWAPFNNGIADNDGVVLTSSIREQGAKVVFASMTTGIYVLDQRPPRLANISTRGQVQTGFDVMIGGFVISGSAPKTVVIRAIGPSLATFGVTGALANPTLQLVRSSDNATIATNDDWGTAANAAQITASGFAPSHPQESAMYLTLQPGAYTAIVSGVGNTSGVGLVEVYEVDHPEVALINISTRGKVQTGFDVMIGGFVVLGDGPQTVVIRAIGPSLANFGVNGALANPTMQLIRISDNATIATNDDWGSASNAALIQSSGFAPSNALESAILISLQPGAYTAIVSGVQNGTGVGLVEVYTVQ